MTAAVSTRARSRGAFRLRAVAPTEHQEQRAIAAALRIELAREGHVSPDGVVWFSIDQANYGGVAPGTRVARGCVAGCPDMILLYRGLAYWIELKSETGSLSAAQREIAVALMRAQCAVGVARNVGEVLKLLDAWNIPRAKRVHL